jgi:hypothetical protein
MTNLTQIKMKIKRRKFNQHQHLEQSSVFQPRAGRKKARISHAD